MIYRQIVGALVGVMLFGMAGTANAVLIANNCGFSGAGDCTLDTVTGLQWLDLTESTNLSFNFVSTQFGSGGQFEGYRYASEAEVFTLFTDAGFTNVGSFTPTIANFAPYAPFVALLGETFPTGGSPFTFGLSDTLCCSGTGVFSPFVQVSVMELTGVAASSADALDAAEVFLGSWLIRVPTVVPEPASLLLFLVGLASLFAFASSGLSAKQKP